MKYLAAGALMSAVFLFSAAGQTTSLICTATAVPPVVRSEGIAERLGDIVLNCGGGQPGAMIQGNLTVFLNVPTTNRQRPDNSLDVALTIDTGSGPQPANAAALPVSSSSFAFNGLSFQVPPSGLAVIRLSNVRGAVNALGLSAGIPIQANLAFNGASVLRVDNNTLNVGYPSRGLFGNATSAQITCAVSPLPTGAVTMSSLFAAGTAFHSTRVTEGFAAAFEKKDATTDNGVRFLVRYSGFPAGARLFLPDVVAGSDALQPTAGGDMGFAQSGGSYLPGSGALLLSRVPSAQADGSGGEPFYRPPSAGPAVNFDSAREVALQNGAGIAVYEVVEADPATIASAQWPTFLAFDGPAGGDTVIAAQNLTLAPISSSPADHSGPVPRFVPAEPPSDCAALGDCSASYMPSLSVSVSAPLAFRAYVGSGPQGGAYIRINNERGGLMSWAVRVAYKQGSGWIRLDRTSGFDNATIGMSLLPEKLAVGTYEATITVDAGPLAGSQSLAVKLEVVAFTPPPQVPLIKSVSNAATMRDGPLVAGSLASVFGEKFAGDNVSVSFDGLPASILYAADTQVNVLVPAALGGRSRAQVVLARSGASSAAFGVDLASSAPGIFSPGILNQDNTVNSAANPAAAGSIVQVFLTGLGTPAAVVVKLHDWPDAEPVYAGPAPGLAGVQQVNVRVPGYAQTINTNLIICGLGPSSVSQPCSPPTKISLKSMD